MAHRPIAQTLIKSLRRTTATSAAAATVVPPLHFPSDYSSPTATSILDLDNTEKLFSGVSTPKLIKTAANLYATGVEPVVDLGTWVMNSRLVKEQGIVRDLILGTVKHTIFEHFCAGETPAEACRTAAKLPEVGLKGMLCFAVEHAMDTEACEENYRGFLETIESTKNLPDSSVSFVILKITAICTMGLLKRVSDLLRWEYNNKSCTLPWKLKTLPIFTDSSPFYHTQSKPEPLTQAELDLLYQTHEKIQILCEKCTENNIPLLIDAEDTTVQPAIDYFTYSATVNYNKQGNPIVFGTMQTYLKDATERLVNAYKEAEKLGVELGVKLVRGAYMSFERERAASLGAESPVHDSIENTHACFNECTSFMLDKAANDLGSVVLATHNVDSGNRAAAEARELGIGKLSNRLQFGQLYGMCDGLSFGLRNAGFQVSKYMPFGPVDLVIPYLLRRAEENRGMLSTSSLDRQLLRKELVRRAKAAVV